MEYLSFNNMTLQITAIILKPNCPKSKGPEPFLLPSACGPTGPWTPLQLDEEAFCPFSLTHACTTAISVFPHRGPLARQQNWVMLASEKNNREKVLCWQIATGEMNYKYASRKNSCRKLCVGVGRTQRTPVPPKDARQSARSASAAAPPRRGRQRLNLPGADLGCDPSSYLMAKTPQNLFALLKSD